MLNHLPPQAVELEEVVLGAMMLEREAVAKMADFLTAEMFYKPAHGLVYKAIMDLYSRKEGVDILTVVQELKRNGTLEDAGGAYAMAQLTSQINSSAHIESHSRIVYEAYLKRSMIRFCGDMLSSCYDDSTDAFELLEEAEKGVLSINRTINTAPAKSTADVVRQSMDNILKNRDRKTDTIGMPTGWKALDRVTLGWQAPDLIIIAARPSMGKTAFGLNIAINCPKPTAFFSLEMTALQLTERVQANDSGVGLRQIKQGDVSQGQLKVLYESADRIAAKPIYIHDENDIKISEICAKSRRLVAKNGVGLIIVDYLQLVNGKTGIKQESRDQEIGNITRSLKQLAKELNVPVICLSQLNRKVEDRQNKIPNLSDLRESGNIEQDADIVSFLYRPEYYGVKVDEEGNSMAGVAILDIAKHRNGELEKVNLKSDLSIQRFSDMPGSESNWQPINGYGEEEEYEGLKF